MPPKRAKAAPPPDEVVQAIINKLRSNESTVKNITAEALQRAQDAVRRVVIGKVAAEIDKTVVARK